MTGHKMIYTATAGYAFTDRAVRKASALRLTADFALAARKLEAATDAYGQDSQLARAYMLGALESESSLTVKAAILTAWGC